MEDLFIRTIKEKDLDICEKLVAQPELINS